MSVSLQKSIWLAFFIVVFASDAIAQPVSDAELTRRQAQQQEEVKSRASNSPDVFTQAGSGGRSSFSLPMEAPCFVIREIEWRDVGELAWIEPEENVLLHRCVGAKGLRAFQNHLMRLMINKGYITSRILIPEQNLASGRLVLQAIPGRFGTIREQGPVPGLNAMAFPVNHGDVLNQRDLDQALENIRRIEGQQDVGFDLVPGAHPGDTDLVIKHPAGKSWHGLLTVDESGANSTGKYQLGGVLTLDSPLRLYDVLTVALTTNANYGNRSLGTKTASVNWSVPIGYWSLLLGTYASRYKQTVAGFSGDIVYGGRSYGAEAGVAWVPYRTSNAKDTVQLKLTRKVSRSEIDDTEIDVQYRNVVGYEGSFSHRQYFGRAVLDFSVGLKGSLPNHSEAPGLIVGTPDWDGRYHIQSASANLSLPFSIAHHPLRYQGSWRLQHADTLLPQFEFFSIGSRYSVRGFDGASSLSAEDGWLVRNDFVWPLGQSAHEIYFGLDIGHVGGPSAVTLLGQSLAGSVLGIRGRGSRFFYDFTIGCPLKKPAQFATQHLTVTASVGTAF